MIGMVAHHMLVVWLLPIGIHNLQKTMVGALVSFNLFFLFRFEGDKMRIDFWLVKQKEWWMLIRFKPHDCSTFIV